MLNFLYIYIPNLNERKNKIFLESLYSIREKLQVSKYLVYVRTYIHSFVEPWINNFIFVELYIPKCESSF